MNLDTMSYASNIKRAVNQVMFSDIGGRWVLFGYVTKAKKSPLMTVNVREEGTIWCDLLDAFEDNEVQYGYAKLDFEAKGDFKLFLIHWMGNKVEENEKLACEPHLNVIRNLMPNHDLLVSAKDSLDINTKVNNYLCRNQPIGMQRSSSQGGVGQEEGKMPKEQDLRVKPRKLSASVNRASTPPGELPVIKVNIIGRAGVGKTYICQSYDRGGIALNEGAIFKANIGLDTIHKVVQLRNYHFTLQMWDTAGSERFDSFIPTLLRNAKVVICVYDICDQFSYDQLPKLTKLAKDYADPRAIYFLVGNKADLADRRQVQEIDAEQFATEHDMTFMECSGMTGQSIMELFESVTEQVVRVYEDVLISPAPDETLKLGEPSRLQGLKGKCCSRR